MEEIEAQLHRDLIMALLGLATPRPWWTEGDKAQAERYLKQADNEIAQWRVRLSGTKVCM